MECTYKISQDSNLLSEIDGIAVTMPDNIGGAFIWQIIPVLNIPPGATTPPVTLSLLPNGGIGPAPGVPPVLTLGPVVGKGAPMLVQPPVPGSENQLWVLQSAPSVLPLPAVFTAFIEPFDQSRLRAATGPVIQSNHQIVMAVLPEMPMHNYLWKFEKV